MLLRRQKRCLKKHKVTTKAKVGLQVLNFNQIRRNYLQHDYQPVPKIAQQRNYLRFAKEARKVLDIELDRPKFPQYAVRASGCQSLQNWQAYLHQTSDKNLAEAGVGDIRQCFFCKGGMGICVPKSGNVKLYRAEDFEGKEHEDVEEDNFCSDKAVAQPAAQTQVDDVASSVEVLSVLGVGGWCVEIKKFIVIVRNHGKLKFHDGNLLEVLIEVEDDMNAPLILNRFIQPGSALLPEEIQETTEGKKVYWPMRSIIKAS